MVNTINVCNQTYAISSLTAKGQWLFSGFGQALSQQQVSGFGQALSQQQVSGFGQALSQQKVSGFSVVLVSLYHSNRSVAFGQALSQQKVSGFPVVLVWLSHSNRSVAFVQCQVFVKLFLVITISIDRYRILKNDIDAHQWGGRGYQTKKKFARIYVKCSLSYSLSQVTRKKKRKIDNQ